MSRWTAVSDVDYHDESNRPRRAEPQRLPVLPASHWVALDQQIAELDKLLAAIRAEREGK